MLTSFVEGTHPKTQNFKNHMAGFVEALKNSSLPIQKHPFEKWEIYSVDFGKITYGSEVTGQRPAILYKAMNWGQDSVVIPLTSLGKDKKSDSFDVFVSKD
jgi:hypothetical protein